MPNQHGRVGGQVAFNLLLHLRGQGALPPVRLGRMPPLAPQEEQEGLPGAAGGTAAAAPHVTCAAAAAWRVDTLGHSCRLCCRCPLPQGRCSAEEEAQALLLPLPHRRCRLLS